MQELITHTDLDGLGCIYILRKAGIKFDKIWLCDTPQCFKPELLGRRSKVWITDLEIRLPGATIFDHHGDRDGKDCGTLQLAKHFEKSLDEETMNFAYSVDAFDTWKDDSPYWNHAVDLQMNYLGQISKFKRPTDSMRLIDKRFEDIVSNLNTLNMADVLFQRNKVKKSISFAKRKMVESRDVEGKTCLSWEFTGEISFTANEILKEYPDVDYAVVFYQSGRVSARSRSDYDVRSLPGINGHARAAGGFNSNDLMDYIGV